MRCWLLRCRQSSCKRAFTLRSQPSWSSGNKNPSLESSSNGRSSVARRLLLLAIRNTDGTGRSSNRWIPDELQLGCRPDNQYSDLSSIWFRGRRNHWRRRRHVFSNTLLAQQHQSVRCLSCPRALGTSLDFVTRNEFETVAKVLPFFLR